MLVLTLRSLPYPSYTVLSFVEIPPALRLVVSRYTLPLCSIVCSRVQLTR